MPISQNIIPTADGLGQIGKSGQRFSGAWFRGTVNCKGQPVCLKYYVASQSGRYALSGYDSNTIPEYGDIIYQISPAALYAVIDPTNLGNESGYQSLNSILTGLTIVVPSGASNDNYGVFIINNSGVEQWAMTPNNLVGFNSSGVPSIILNTNGSGYFTSNLTAVNFIGSFSGNGANLTGIRTSGVNSLIVSGLTFTGNVTISGSGASFASFTGQTIVLNTPVGGITNSIQLNTNGTLGANLWFKFDTGVWGFGYSPNPLRGAFDVYHSFSGSGLLSLASGITVSGSGTGPYSSTLLYNVYSYRTISGINYYSTTYASGSGNVGSSKNAYVSWTSPGAPVSGFRIVGVSGSSVTYETTGSNFIDSGINNASGAIYPTYTGPNLWLDNLSNLWLTGGYIYVNGCRVLTLCDTGLFSSPIDTGQFVLRSETGQFARPSGIGRVMVFCAGFTPNSTGPDVAELPVPYDDDGRTPLNWGIVRVTLRVQQAGGSPSITLQKYAGSGAFIGNDILTITMPSGGYETVLHS